MDRGLTCRGIAKFTITHRHDVKSVPIEQQGVKSTQIQEVALAEYLE